MIEQAAKAAAAAGEGEAARTAKQQPPPLPAAATARTARVAAVLMREHGDDEEKVDPAGTAGPSGGDRGLPLSGSRQPPKEAEVDEDGEAEQVQRKWGRRPDEDGAGEMREIEKVAKAAAAVGEPPLEAEQQKEAGDQLVVVRRKWGQVPDEDEEQDHGVRDEKEEDEDVKEPPQEPRVVAAQQAAGEAP